MPLFWFRYIITRLHRWISERLMPPELIPRVRMTIYEMNPDPAATEELIRLLRRVSKPTGRRIIRDFCDSIGCQDRSKGFRSRIDDPTVRRAYALVILMDEYEERYGRRACLRWVIRELQQHTTLYCQATVPSATAIESENARSSQATANPALATS